jgi:hypothetical protein
MSVRTKMTDDEVKAAFAAIAAKMGGQKVEGVILQEIVTPDGMRWLNPAPTPMSPKMAAALVRSVMEAAPATQSDDLPLFPAGGQG